jgi:FkbM family methyltransferase
MALIDSFLKSEYEIPEVLSGLKSKDVIDVGAGIGDSALYFILRGARKVIAVEPLPNVVKCAEENLRLNNVADKVKIVNAALGGEPMSIPCDYDVRLSGSFSMLKDSSLCKVSGVTLGDLLSMIDDPYLLKMDCKGCEAEAILGPEGRD